MSAGRKNRGFVLTRQKVVLDIDFAGSLTATTQIVIRPTEPSLQTVYLHAASCLKISSVSLSSPTAPDPLPELPAHYAHSDPLQNLAGPSKPSTTTTISPDDGSLSRHPAIKRQLWAALAEKEEGELAIDVSQGWIRIARDDQGQIVSSELAEISINIDYEIVMDKSRGTGIIWRRPGDDGVLDRAPHVFLSSATFDAARHWVPCVDSLWDRCQWDLQFVVPRSLVAGGEGEPQSSERVLVVSSGALEDTLIHPSDPSRVIYQYGIQSPTTVQHVTFAVGPFHMHVIPANPSGSEESTFSLSMMAFCLPGFEMEVEHSTACLRPAMDFFSDYGSYPFDSFKVVFVEEPTPQCHVGQTMALASQDLLYPPEIPDQAHVTRPLLTHALAAQWIGIDIIARTWADGWLTTGLAHYMNNQFTRASLGENEYRFKHRLDMEQCFALDQGWQYPLCLPGKLEPPDDTTQQFVTVKAPLVLSMLDRRMKKIGTSLGLSRVIPKIFSDCLSGRVVGNQLTTEYFQRACRGMGKVDMQPFFDQWIHGSGVPRLYVSATGDRKRSVVDMTVVQVCPAYEWVSKHEPHNLQFKKPTRSFEGAFTLRVQEEGDLPIEHTIDLEAGESLHPLPFTPKLRRWKFRAGRSRGFKLVGLEPRAEQGDQPATGTPGAGTGGVGGGDGEQDPLDVEWKFTDWTDEERSRLLQESYDWIRFDPDLEWILRVEWQHSLEKLRELALQGRTEQVPGPMVWAFQLENEKDVVAQKEAINALAGYASHMCATVLTRVALDDNYFYRVRMAAVEALVAYNVNVDAETPSIGIFHLTKLLDWCLNEQMQSEESSLDHRRLPHHIAESLTRYWLFRAIVASLARVVHHNHKAVAVNGVRRRLMRLMDREEDLTFTHFSDANQKAAVILSLAGVSQSAVDDVTRAATLQVIRRCAMMDRLLPSYANSVTVAALKSLFILALGDKANPATRLPSFLPYTRPGNHPNLRKVALDCALACQLPEPFLVDWLLRVLRDDPSFELRRHVARALVRSWATALAFGEVPGLYDPKEAERRGVATNDAELERLATARLRDALAVHKRLPAALLDILQAPGTDHHIRLNVLSTVETLFPGVNEGGAKIVLNLNASGNRVSQQNRTRVGVDHHEDVAVTKKKAKKPQKEKLSKEDAIIIDKILRDLERHKTSAFFREPVPYNEEFAPGYHKIIKQPMDLTTIGEKLNNEIYTNREQFRTDVVLIITNAQTYNREGDLVWNEAEAFRAVFEERWAKAEKAFAAMQKRRDAVVAVDDEVVVVPAPTLQAKPPTVKLKIARPGSATARAVHFPGEPAQTSETGSSQPTVAASGVQKVTLKLNRPAMTSSSSTPTPSALPSAKRSRQDASSAPVDVDADLEGEMDLMDEQQTRAPKKPKLQFKRSGAGAAVPSAARPAQKIKAESSAPAASAPPPSTAPPAVEIAPAALGVSAADPAQWEQLLDESVPFFKLRAIDMVDQLWKEPSALFFLQPVKDRDAPGYSQEIAYPMDLGTIRSKIQTTSYQSMAAFYRDLKAIVDNCRQYNGAISEMSNSCANPFERKILSLSSQYKSDQIARVEMTRLQRWFTSIKNKKQARWYLAPVDPIADGILNYFDVIPRDKARDLGTISKQLSAGAYKSLAALDDDVYQCLSNARAFNPESTIFHQDAVWVGKEWDKMRSEMEPHRKAEYDQVPLRKLK